MNKHDREFIRLHGESNWILLRAWKTRGHIKIEKKADLLAYLSTKKRGSISRSILDYWLKLLNF